MVVVGGEEGLLFGFGFVAAFGAAGRRSESGFDLVFYFFAGFAEAAVFADSSAAFASVNKAFWACNFALMDWNLFCTSSIAFIEALNLVGYRRHRRHHQSSRHRSSASGSVSGVIFCTWPPFTAILLPVRWCKYRPWRGCVMSASS